MAPKYIDLETVVVYAIRKNSATIYIYVYDNPYSGWGEGNPFDYIQSGGGGGGGGSWTSYQQTNRGGGGKPKSLTPSFTDVMTGGDYVNASLTIPVSGLVGFNISVNRDKFGTVYLSPGIGLGARRGLSFSVTTNNLPTNYNPTPSDMQNFLSGHSLSLNFSALTGGTGTWSVKNGYSTYWFLYATVRC